MSCQCIITASYDVYRTLCPARAFAPCHGCKCALRPEPCLLLTIYMFLACSFEIVASDTLLVGLSPWHHPLCVGVEARAPGRNMTEIKFSEHLPHNKELFDVVGRLAFLPELLAFENSSIRRERYTGLKSVGVSGSTGLRTGLRGSSIPKDMQR